MQLREEDFDNVNPGEARPLIEEGLWPADFVGLESRSGRWGEKLYANWKVFIAPGKGQFVVLPRYYTVERDGGGRFKFGRLHAYRKDWIASNGGRVPLDANRLPPSIWQKRTFLVEVATVRMGSDGVPLLRSLYWS